MVIFTRAFHLLLRYSFDYVCIVLINGCKKFR